MRLVMRSWKLKAGANIAIPAFVCNSVRRAVCSEHLSPTPFDLKPNSFWTDYNEQAMLDQNIEGIVLVHLYGYLHPDSPQIEVFAKKHSIPLLHDLAQCHGVDESMLDASLPRVYSFSQGKPTTGAFGGLIKNLDADFYNSNIKRELNPTLRKMAVTQFMKSRIYGYTRTVWDNFTLRFLRLASVVRRRGLLTSITDFQKKAAGEAIRLQAANLNERKKRYQKLVEAAESTGKLKTAIHDANGLFFKAVFFATGDATALRKYLKDNEIPHFVLADDLKPELKDATRFPNYAQQAHTIIELPCEASIPLDEIQRLEVILRSA